MLPRRSFLLALAALLLSPPAQAADDPAAPLRAIYKRVVASYDAKRNNTDNGYFIWKDDRTRARWFSAAMVKLWHEAEARTAKGDQGPPGFDPVTNSQDPLVRAFVLAIEKQDARAATVVVRIAARPGPLPPPTAAGTLRYDMVRENSRWLIDDIRGAIDTPWSLRQLLIDHKG